MQYGLTVKSEYQAGTCVSFIIPARDAGSVENAGSAPDIQPASSPDKHSASDEKK
jgi:hypothetical protein